MHVTCNQKQTDMKKILVPTDFSYCAKYALDAAAKLAQQYEADLYIFHHLASLPKDWHNLMDLEQNLQKGLKQEVHNAEVLLADLKSKYLYLNVETGYAGGSFATSLQLTVEQEDIDLIVMGSHGASGKKEWLIGSNAQKVVRQVHCPVLVIKEPVEEISFDKVVFASGFGEQDKSALVQLVELVKPYNPTLHLVYINTDPFWGLPYSTIMQLMNEFKPLCGELDCKLHYFRDLAIERGIRYISNDLDADLIAISNYERHPLKRIFIGSNVEMLVNHADIPVLSLDYRPTENEQVENSDVQAELSLRNA